MKLSDEISAEEVHYELNRILASSDFQNSKNLVLFLDYIVEKTISGQGKELKAYTVAVEALGRSSDFDPQSDPFVRVQAGRLRQKLLGYYLTEGKDRPIRIEIPKGGYVPVLSRADQAETSRQTSPHMSCSQLHSNKYGHPSLVLQAIQPLGPTPDHNMAQILSQELMTALLRFQPLKVIGPLSSCMVDETKTCHETPYGSGCAQFILSGSIQLTGSVLRMRVNLKEMASKLNLWAKSFAFDMRNQSSNDAMNDLVEEITGKISGERGIIFQTLIEQLSTCYSNDTTPFVSILRTSKWGMDMREESYKDALAALLVTVESFPDYAPSKAALADLYTSTYAYSLESCEKNLDRGENLAIEALKLDPTCQYAQWVRGWTYLLRGETARGVRYLEDALLLNPLNVSTLGTCSLFFIGVGDLSRASAMMEKALRIDPKHPGWYPIVQALRYYLLGDFSEALEQAQKISTPSFIWGSVLLAATYGQLGEPENAGPYLNSILQSCPEFSTTGKQFIGKLLFTVEHTDMLWQGLVKAGLLSDHSCSASSEN